MEDKRLAEVVGMTWRDMMNLADECLGPDEARIESGIIAAREYDAVDAWKMYVAAKLLKTRIVNRAEIKELFPKIPGLNDQKGWKIKVVDFVSVNVNMTKLKKQYIDAFITKR